MALIDHHSEAPTEVRSSRLWTMVSGIAFAVLFVAGIFLGTDTPDYDAADSEWTDWFNDSGNRWNRRSSRCSFSCCLRWRSSCSSARSSAGCGHG